MEINSPKLFIEINKSEYVFFVMDRVEENNPKLIYSHYEPLVGIKHKTINDLELAFNTIKKIFI